MRIIIYGARGSYPVLCHGWTEFNEFIQAHIGGETRPLPSANTSCVYIDSKVPSFFDAGTGLFLASNSHKKEILACGEMNIFFSHFHWDHLVGLTTLYPYFAQNIKTNIYSCHDIKRDEILSIFKERHCPLSAEQISSCLNFVHLKENETAQVSDLKITPAKAAHPGGTYLFKVERENSSMIYGTDFDIELMKPEISFAQGVDTALLDTHFLPEDISNEDRYGHSDCLKIVEYCVESKIKQLVMFHINPYYDFKKVFNQHEIMQKHAADLNSELKIIMPFDGLKLDL